MKNQQKLHEKQQNCMKKQQVSSKNQQVGIDGPTVAMLSAFTKYTFAYHNNCGV